MKKYKNKTNIIICISLVLFLILSFTSYKLSYSIKSNEVVPISTYDKPKMTDEEVWNFLSTLDDTKMIGNTGTSYLDDIEIKVQEKNDNQDPEKIIKANENKKGVAKKSEVKEAVKKYESNETSFGIDVSTWQNKIDWKKVRQSGVTFAMIRAGFRRLDSGEIVMDNRFLENIKGAIANNINVGVYFFSMARNNAEALEEAEWLVNVIKDYDITYPLAIDIEIFNQNRLTGVSYDTMTNNALVFCEYVKKKGYTPMIYSYAKALTNYFNTPKFKDNRIWLAQYNDKVTYNGKYHMWQYTSNGSVPGINGRVDMNVAYFSITNDVTKSTTVTGIDNQPFLPTINFIDMNMKTTLSKNVLLKSSPYNNLPNRAGTLNEGNEITVTGMSDNFIRINYQDNTFYINDTECFIMNNEILEFEETNQQAIITKYITLLKEPYEYLKNNIYTYINNEKITITGINDNYIRLIYEDNTYYTKNTNFYTIIKEPTTEEPTTEPQEVTEE